MKQFILKLKKNNIYLSIRDLNSFVLSLDTFWVDNRIKLADFNRSMSKAVQP